MRLYCVFFFKQKTAYEMRISDWSSDVCSSDLDIGHGDRRGQMPEGNMIAAERLEREVGVEHLVIGIAVEQLCRLIVHDFANQRGDRLALVEPLSAQLRQRLGRLGLVERSEEHTSELQSLMRLSYAVFCLNNKNTKT